MPFIAIGVTKVSEYKENFQFQKATREDADQYIDNKMIDTLKTLRLYSVKASNNDKLATEERNCWRKLSQLTNGATPYLGLSLQEKEKLLLTLYKVLEEDGGLNEKTKLKEMLIRGLSGDFVSTKRVVLCSPFSWGKSTLLNGIIGEELLQTDIRAETALVTRILHGNKYALVIEDDHTITTVDAQSIKHLTQLLTKLTGVRSEKLSSLNAKIREFYAAGKQLLLAINKKDRIFMAKENEETLIQELLLSLNLPNLKVVVVSGYHALRASQWLNNRITTEEINGDDNLFVIKNQGIIPHKLLKQDLAEDMLTFSNIHSLQQFVTNNWHY